MAKGGFGTTYKAIWKDGYIFYTQNNQFIRKKDNEKGHPVALKCLHNSQDITVEFLEEVWQFFIILVNILQILNYFSFRLNHTF